MQPSASTLPAVVVPVVLVVAAILVVILIIGVLLYMRHRLARPMKVSEFSCLQVLINMWILSMKIHIIYCHACNTQWDWLSIMYSLSQLLDFGYFYCMHHLILWTSTFSSLLIECGNQVIPSHLTQACMTTVLTLAASCLQPWLTGGSYHYRCSTQKTSILSDRATSPQCTTAQFKDLLPLQHNWSITRTTLSMELQ